MFGSIENYENEFFVNGQKILGVESIDLNYSNNFNVEKFLGTRKGLTTISGPTSQKISINRNLIYNDPLLFFTGSTSFSGSINFETKTYGFNSGFLDDYTINCAVGSVPKINLNATIYDELTTGKSSKGSISSPSIYIPNQGSISITCDGSSTNRVVGFDYAIKVFRKPIYSIGSKFVNQVVTMPNIEFAASVQIDLDDLFLRSGFDFISDRQNKNLSFFIKSRDLTQTLQSLTMPNASLVGESLSNNADGGIKLTLNYIGHL